MGWKASCILVNERGRGHLGRMPSHDSGRARDLIGDLGLGRHRSRGMTTFDEGIYPDRLAVGAYDGAAIIGHPQVGDSCLDSGADPMTARILAAFPQASVLRVGLNSVINLWSYAYFEAGQLVRAYGGCADEGVIVDVGDLLPEERPHFERSVVLDGERFFYADINGAEEEFDASAFGEELVFEVMGRFFGCRPDRAKDESDPFELPMEAFERVGGGRWWWPFRTSGRSSDRGRRG